MKATVFGCGARRMSLALMVVLGAVALAGVGCGDKKKGLYINKLSPKTGPYTGGSQVTIFGSGFASEGAQGVKVLFGDKIARVIAFEGDSKLIVEPPPSGKGKIVDVILMFDDGSSFEYKEAYTYVDLAKGFDVSGLTGEVDEK